MEFYEIKQLLELPAIQLLRIDNAPLVLGFLHRTFKRSLRTTVPEGELRSLLDVYLSELREAGATAYSDSAADYLAVWRDEKHGFLRRSYADGQNEPVFELTAGSEKALFWIESLKQVEFIGTESRLASIFAGLDEIVRYASDDADERISLLLKDGRRIQDEIDNIRATGVAEKYSPVKLNERYARLITTARELLSDFRAVEEKFQHIAQEIAEKHVQPGVTKGSIVGHMLDSHDVLKQSAQGQSYYAFRELLLSPERQEHFDDAIEASIRLQQLSEELRANSILPQLIGKLLIEDETVVASTHRVSANLRRVLDTSNLSQRRMVTEIIRDIKSLALQQKENIRYDDIFFELEELVDPYWGISPSLWREPPRIVPQGPIEVADDDLGWEELRKFRNLPQIRLQDLRRNVEFCLEGDETVILSQVLTAFPPKHGMIEVLGYLIIAAQEDRHYVADSDNTEVTLPSGEKWRIPAVLFGRSYAR